MSGVKINFIKLLAAKAEEINKMPSLNDVAAETGIDRRKLYTLRDLATSDAPISGEKFPLNLGEAKALCDFLGCKMGELIDYTPNSLLRQASRCKCGNLILH